MHVPPHVAIWSGPHAIPAVPDGTVHVDEEHSQELRHAGTRSRPAGHDATHDVVKPLPPIAGTRQHTPVAQSPRLRHASEEYVVVPVELVSHMPEGSHA